MHSGRRVEAATAYRGWRRLHHSQLSRSRSAARYAIPAMTRYEIFDRSRLEIKPLAERRHDLHLDRWLALDDVAPPFSHSELPVGGPRVSEGRTSGAARIA